MVGSFADGISPKVAVITIGTNNSKTDSPENTAEGIREICAVLRAKLQQVIKSGRTP